MNYFMQTQALLNRQFELTQKKIKLQGEIKVRQLQLTQIEEELKYIDKECKKPFKEPEQKATSFQLPK